MPGWRTRAIGFGWTFLITVFCATDGFAQQAPDEARSQIAAAPGVEATAALQTYAAMPLAFEENRGQFDAQVRYAARGAGRTLFLTASEAVVALQPDPARPASAVRLRFDGAATDAMRIAGEDVLPTRTQYFTGRDPARWQTDVRSFGKVRYRNVYPGIDVVYYGNRRQLEYDLILAPHALARRIDLRFDGADRVDIDRDGDLVLETRNGRLKQKKPIAWQLDGGERRLVDAHYIRRDRGIGIALADYDRRKALTIDPQVLFYATYLGGTGADKALAVSADAAGATYVAGLTQSIDFPAMNAAQPVKGGATDAFVAKLDAKATALVYATYLGGIGVDAALGIARDAAGNAYIAGYTASNDFPVTPDALQSNLHGSAYDAFVAKLGADGALHYSTYLGGSDIDVANAIAIDAAGHAFIAGYTCSSDFPVANAFQPQLAGPPLGCFSAKDAFVSKIEPGAPALSYSTYLGGGGSDEAKAIAVDLQGQASVTGATWSNDFPLEGVVLSAHAGGSDAFVSRFTASGSLDYSTYFGGSGEDTGLGIAAGNAGSLYIAGATQSADFPIVDAFQPALHGPQDGFVARLIVHTGVPDGTFLEYASYLGGRDEDAARAITVDSGGYAYVTGETHSLDFPLYVPMQPTLRGSGDAFVSRIHPLGALTYSTFVGGNGEDAGWGVALSSGLLRGTSNVHVVGMTLSTDLATAGVVQPAWQGLWDGFVCKIGYVP